MIWCAEIGSMHNGDKSLAFELIRQAVGAGSNLIKFQLGWTESAQARYCDGFDERRFIDDWVPEIDEWCRRFGVEWFASIWSFEGLEVARSVDMKRYKIAHQIGDISLLGEILGDGKPVFWSNGLAGFDERAYEIGTTHEYPTYPTGKRMLDDGEWPYGYSSHMHGIGDALIAVARGAKYIEKHFTLDKTGDWPRDRSFALLPDEFEQMVKVGNEMAALL